MIAEIYIPGIGSRFRQITSNIPVTASRTTKIFFIFKPATQWHWVFYPIKPVTTLYIAINSHIPILLTLMQGQKLLMLLARAFSWSGRERVAFFLAYEGGQYSQYASRWPSLWLMTWLIWPKGVDARLTLSFRIRQGERRLLFDYHSSMDDIYASLRPIAAQSNHNAQPNIVESLLTLILPLAYPQHGTSHLA